MKPRIAIIVYDLSVVGGAEKVSVNIANALKDYYEVFIVSLHGERSNPVYYIDDGISIVYLGLDDHRLRQQIFDIFIPIIKFYKKERIDVSLIEGNYCGILCSFARPFVNTRFIFCDHGSFMSQYNEKSIRFIRRISTLICDHTVVLTERSKADYIKHFRIKENKIDCVYNWVEDYLVDSAVQYNTSSKTIISVGRFGPEKGYDLMVKVAERVMPKHIDWKWIIYGNGESFETIKKQVSEKKLDKQVILAGECTNVSDAYKKAALLVLPSYREGLPLVLLEGKCYKLPLVSFDILTGPREIIQDGISGFLVPPYDIDLMAERISELIVNKDLRKEMSDHAYDNIDKFKKSTIIRKWVSLIDSVRGIQ